MNGRAGRVYRGPEIRRRFGGIIGPKELHSFDTQLGKVLDRVTIIARDVHNDRGRTAVVRMGLGHQLFGCV